MLLAIVGLLPGVVFSAGSSARDTRPNVAFIIADGTQELYDHQADPHEFKSLSSDESAAPAKNQLLKSLPEKWSPSLGGRKG